MAFRRLLPAIVHAEAYRKKLPFLEVKLKNRFKVKDLYTWHGICLIVTCGNR